MDSRMLEGFKKLGFNIYEAKAYIAMLGKINPLTAYEIGKLSGVPRSKVYEVVDRLFQKQIIVKVDENPNRYLPVDPDEVLSNFESSFNSCISFLRAEMSQLERGETIDYIFNIFGKETIIQRARNMINSASSSILVAVDGTMLRILEGELKTAEARGVELNIVFYGDRDGIDFRNTFSHKLMLPDIKNYTYILLDIDFKEVLAGTMSLRTNEGHGFWTKSVYLNNIMQDNIVHEISLGLLEEALGVNRINELTRRIPDRLWDKAMLRFNSKFHIH